MPTPIGIDVAVFETVDWQRAADAGVMLGITKAFQFNPDPTFARNWEGIRNAGMLRGAFFFMPGPNLAVPTFAEAQTYAQATNHTPLPVTMQDYSDLALWAVNSRPTVATVPAGVDHAIDMITQAGGLEQGDLPPVLDAEDQSIKVQIADAAGHTSMIEAAFPNGNQVNGLDFVANQSRRSAGPGLRGVGEN